jgi:tRNA(fMet)-specific endonuclease VapC
MDAVLLDTDVFSYLMKRGDPRAEAYTRHVKNKTIAVSFVTVGELYSWAEKRQWGAAHKEDLETRLRSVIVVPFDLDLCRAYGRLVLLKTADGTVRNLAANDRWIAACAIRHNLSLLSNNRRHFENIPGLTLISEAPVPRRPRSERLPLSEGPE